MDFGQKMDTFWTKFWTKNGQNCNVYIQNLIEKRYIYKLLFMLTIFTIYTIKILLNKISNKLYNKAKAQ